MHERHIEIDLSTLDIAVNCEGDKDVKGWTVLNQKIFFDVLGLNTISFKLKKYISYH